jgi:solute carrier family 41
MNRLQIIVPFFIAGIGTCFAGILLDHVQYWKVFDKLEELFLLLPALLGLKGNLQMTLASRLSTHSHLGHLQTTEDLLGLTCANLSLNQCLSIVISLTASILVVLIHLVTSDGPFDERRALLITATALLTSSVTSFLLDILMIVVVQFSARLNINPDNVATPIAASLGDMTALILCSMLAKLFYEAFDTQEFYWITIIVILFYVLLIHRWAVITQENIHTANIIVKASHWYPLITAMVISSISGIILKAAVALSDDIALFQPVICGVGGNLVAVQASRLSTLLHRSEPRGTLPEGESICMNPCHMLTNEGPGFSITRLLMSIVIPGQIVFYFLCIYVNSRQPDVSLPFLLFYLVGSETQVIVLLYLAYVLTFLLWKLDIDPDNCIIPYLTSISDLLGACIITLICLIVVPTTATPN